jgi:hypothetical protein
MLVYSELHVESNDLHSMNNSEILSGEKTGPVTPHRVSMYVIRQPGLGNISQSFILADKLTETVRVRNLYCFN